MEYIERKAALDAIWQGCGACAEELEQLPVVEIVKCEECKHQTSCLSEVASLNKTLTGTLYTKIEFCSRGERKES